jgi:ArsR family transcriptional regulator, arsenate/arsenite/antimonite-responsive transcriptional repressor
MIVYADGASLAGWIDGSQDRDMSIPTGRAATAVLPVHGSRADAEACSTPLVGEPISEGAAAELAQVFRALGDPVRLRLVSLIGAHQGGEVCVCDLTTAFALTQPTISHHLKVLREAGIIDCERRGTWVYYWVVPAALERMAALLSVPGGLTSA